ncbi:hypothetical protein MFMK1_003577 [Metallumcola ferriviriculae]|uniref:Cardiolipin synthase N-terminal domain-containing protein n=1 Tax=Metallumcola ferriviriculae TaxID=3039180 RepID=A0AAU0UQW7_9FIRM|nr:hypothetical protein MFMK1_003577 [Desulfitibacteraceae bacterium MK1]
MSAAVIAVQIFNALMLLLAVISGIYVWFNARKIGMNHWVWTILTVVLFPIGLISYLLYRYLKLKN